MTQTIEYTARIAGTDHKFTAHRTKAAARRSLHEAHNPLLVEVEIGGDTYYDAFPAGHPLPANVTPIERCTLTASGMRWRAV